MVEATGQSLVGIADMEEVDRWKSELGLPPDETVAVIRDVLATKRDWPPSAFAGFLKTMQRFAGGKGAAETDTNQKRGK